MNLRNLLALFYQVRAFLESSLGNEVITNMTNRMLTTNHLDDEWLALVVARPARFSAGMLSSNEADARADMFTREASIHIECDEQRKKVVEARLNFFQAALHRDQIKIARFKEVPKKIAQKQHLKTLAQHRLQAENGEKAIKDYTNKVSKSAAFTKSRTRSRKLPHKRMWLQPGSAYSALPNIYLGLPLAHRYNLRAIAPS